MNNKSHKLISFVIPAYNEGESLPLFHAKLIDVVDTLAYQYEIIYCDDGSTDDTAAIIKELISANDRVRLVSLSRNFGKEAALSAGIAAAKGEAIITLDADGQQPVACIPEFIQKWEQGAEVVVGIHTNSTGKGMFKNSGPKLFYKLLNTLSGQHIENGSSDFRLITHEVQQAFITLSESERITRGLIDWLGFRREYIYFENLDRLAGSATYSNVKLLKLAANSFVSLSPQPLYLFGYLGVIITIFSFILGSAIFMEQLVFNDPLYWNFTGTAMLGVLILFLVGLVLLSQGILSLYVSHIHTQSKQRPLYVVNYKHSIGVKKPHTNE